MEFKDVEISDLDLDSPENISRLIIRYLCGENYDLKLFEEDRKLLADLISNAKQRGLNYRQFDELLLLLNQDTVRKDFFNFFFEKDRIMLDDLKKSITKLRGFAMLCFGNFRFAYKRLIQKNEDELKKELSPYWKPPSDLMEEFGKRPFKMLEIEKITRDKTWLVGELSGKEVNKEAEVLKRELEKADKGKSRFSKKELLKFGEKLLQIEKHLKEAQELARRNTDIYLTWDYMDIYFATSMRNQWEFEETFDFIQEVFGDSRLKELNLRYFDPTQSKCGNPRDKGLIEGLMLKRALCTIYLAQESDTMGKDSELAATLAQGKPVVAYVPKYNPETYSKKIARYPLDFFKRRLKILDAEETFEEPECAEKLRKIDKNYEKRIERFLTELEEYRLRQPFSLWSERDDKFKRKYADFPKICDILATTECYNFERRAELLKGRHPLCMQVDLQSGVANGVLVVRNPEDCAELLFRILTNRMKFTIKHEKFKTEDDSRKFGYSFLEEEVSGCAYRVVTDYEKLTNSFWNYYLP